MEHRLYQLCHLALCTAERCKKTIKIQFQKLKITHSSCVLFSLKNLCKKLTTFSTYYTNSILKEKTIIQTIEPTWFYILKQKRFFTKTTHMSPSPHHHHHNKKGRMLKAPPVNPQTYISLYYNIDLTEGRYYVQKYVRKRYKPRVYMYF